MIFRFPFNNRETLKKWVDFIAQSGSNSTRKSLKTKKISKYSSICCRHFLPSDFIENRFSRKFLKKCAIPTISGKDNHKTNSPKEDPANDESDAVEVEASDPLNIDFCSLCRSSATVNITDDFVLNLIRKCLPISVNISSLQKVCDECIKNLKSFSSFIDKVSATHRIPERIDNLGYTEVNMQRNIKVEPITSTENDEKRPSIQVINFAAQEPSLINPSYLSMMPNPFTPQKKCEILEIIDIKPFHYEAMQQESYDNEDDIQILSPKQMKVELTDPDEDGSNELELIRNYMYISTVFLQDHNYSKCTLEGVEQNVKTENDDDFLEVNSENHAQQTAARICKLCNASFRTFRQYLMHKTFEHQSRSRKNHRRQATHRDKVKKIREICTKIIKRKKKKVSLRKPRKLKEKKKSYTCPICSKVFRGSKNLYQHSISHSNMFYSCSLCTKKFKRSHGLKQHFKSIHENEKNHVCPICEHSYLLKADMIKCRHSRLKKI